MYRQKLLVLLLLAQGAGALPLIRNEGKYCLKPDICATVSVTAIDSSDPALNKFADGLFNRNSDREAGKVYHFDQWDQAGLEAWIRRVATAQLDASEVPNNDYYFNYTVSQSGETSHYRVLQWLLSSYTGGAHGLVSGRFYVVPKQGELKALPLADILLPDQRGRLDKLQEENFRRWLRSAGGDIGPMDEQQLKEHFEIFPFKANDNWRFDREGLVFQYDPYEIAPYALGRPEILVPTAQLAGVIRPEILKELASWQSTAESEPVSKPQWRK